MKILLLLFFILASIRSFAGFNGNWQNNDLSRVYQCDESDKNSIVLNIKQNYRHFHIKKLQVICGDTNFYEKSLQRLKIRHNELLSDGKVVGKILDNSFFLILPEKERKLIVRGDRRDRELAVYISDYANNQSVVNVLAHLERQL